MRTLTLAFAAAGLYGLWALFSDDADFSGRIDRPAAQVYSAFEAVPLPVDPNPVPRIRLQVDKMPGRSIDYALVDMKNATVRVHIDFLPKGDGATKVRGVIDYADLVPLNSPSPGPRKELAAKFQAMVDEISAALAENRSPRSSVAAQGLAALAIPSAAWRDASKPTMVSQMGPAEPPPPPRPTAAPMVNPTPMVDTSHY